MPTSSIMNLSNLINTYGTGLRGIARSERSVILFNDYNGPSLSFEEGYFLIQFGDHIIDDGLLPCCLATIDQRGGYTVEPLTLTEKNEQGRWVFRVDKLPSEKNGLRFGKTPEWLLAYGLHPINHPTYQEGFVTANGLCRISRSTEKGHQVGGFRLDLDLANGMLTIGGKRVECLVFCDLEGRYDTPVFWEAVAGLLDRPHALRVGQVEEFFARHGSVKDMQYLGLWYIAEELDENMQEWKAYQWEDLR